MARRARGIDPDGVRAAVEKLRSSVQALTLEQVAALSDRIIGEVERAIVGKRDVLALVLMAVLADGHVLIEDVPGLAKTLMARSFAAVARLDFKRIQFTPDLMPSDVTGSLIYNQRSGDFVFRPGPVFANFLLADEVNRAPAKTQAALLEAMQERQVTIEGTTHPLPPPFIVMATQNPIEFEGTYPLPEAQLDRFLVRTGVGYPSREEEWQVLSHRPPGRRGRARSSRRRRDVDRDAAGDGVGPRRPECREIHGRVGRGDTAQLPGPGRRQPPRVARLAQTVALPGGHAGARLRHP